MSTSYYIGCETCRECYLIGQNGWKFFTFYSGEPRCMAGIGKFLERHVLCDRELRVMSERSVEVEEFNEIEWPL